MIGISIKQENHYWANNMEDLIYGNLYSYRDNFKNKTLSKPNALIIQKLLTNHSFLNFLL